MAVKQPKKPKRKYNRRADIPRCTAHSAATGKPCKNPPVRGSTVCRHHGGASPQAKAKALNRLDTRKEAKKAYTEALGQLGGTNKHPIMHLLDELFLSYNVVAVLTRQVEQLGDITQWSEHERTSNIIYRLWCEERDRHAKLAAMALKAGVDERQTQILEAQAEMYSAALYGILTDLGISLEDKRVSSIVRKHLLRLQNIAPQALESKDD
jgi:hypothetical protein